LPWKCRALAAIAISAEARSAASFARFDFAATFAIKHQYLGQSRHRRDRTDYLHWLVAKQEDGSATVVWHSRCTFSAPQREKDQQNMQGPLARLCFNRISCPKKNDFVAEPSLGRTIAKD
jgi:hypothetical protein